MAAPPRNGDDPILVFDPAAVRRHRARAAPGFAAHGFLFDEIASRLVERLGDLRRTFPVALDLGARGGVLARAFAGPDVPADRFGIRTLVHADRVADGLRGLAPAVVADPEALPFAPGAFDLVVSCLDLHWANDLPGALAQLRRALRPDGLLLVALFGGETLTELRTALLEAELLVEGGAGPRVSPFADLADAGALLQRAGFALPVADSDTLTVRYRDVAALFADLRGMGETNALRTRRRGFSRRATLAEAAAIYARRFAGPDGRVKATFQVLTLTGWAPHASQQAALRPGSARTRLAQALDAVERPAGDTARR